MLTHFSLICSKCKCLNGNYIVDLFLIISKERKYEEENKLKWTNWARGRNPTPQQKKRGAKWETYRDETDGRKTGQDTIRTNRRGRQVGLPDLDRSTEQRRCQSQHAGEENFPTSELLLEDINSVFLIIMFNAEYERIFDIHRVFVDRIHHAHPQHMIMQHCPTNISLYTKDRLKTPCRANLTHFNIKDEIGQRGHKVCWLIWK